MKYITTIIKNTFTKELPRPLGRWKIDYSNSVINTKIDSSNEDNCGPCGQYTLMKLEIENKEIKDSKSNNRD